MNKLEQLVKGEIFVDTDKDLRRINKKTYRHEISFDEGKSWKTKRYLNIDDIKNWQPYEPVETYKSDDIEFTVKEIEDCYELQFQKYPDELRVGGVIGKIDDKITISSVRGVAYHNNRKHLYLPGIEKNCDNDIVLIPKSHVPKDFFNKLLELLKDKLKEVRKPEYLTHSELIVFLQENDIKDYDKLVFEWDGNEWEYCSVDIGIGFADKNGYIMILETLERYVRYNKAKARLR